MSDRREVAHNVNILVLDGGGASGLSSLLILREVMNRLQRYAGLADSPDVRKYFDFVAGTGTGAVAACMLGRLRMPLDRAISYYQGLTKVFSDRKLLGPTAFKTSKLKAVLRGIVREATGDENTLMLDTSPDADKCKTMVFARSMYNLNAGIPVIFRSYSGVANQMPDCAVWEVLCATMAHPELFKSINIGEPPMHMPFVDGGLGCSNPTAHVLAEAKAVHPSGHLACVISIGAGHASTIQLPKSGPLQWVLPIGVLVAMRNIAADSERVAQEMAMRFGRAADAYFRLNVDQGMQNVKMSEWEKLCEVAAHTMSYMSALETSKKMDRAAKAIAERKASVIMSQVDGELQVCGTQQPLGGKLCPAPTPLFTGREDNVEQVVACISQGDTQRCVFVLHGLGGAGKTQIALKAIERTRNIWTDIVYVDATSRDTAVRALGDFAKLRQIGDTYETVVQWLGDRPERWVMVFDNADDMALRIHDFFPTGNHGSILITTRLVDLALHARGSRSECGVSGMDSQGAMDLLLKAARIEGGVSGTEHKAAIRLLQDFGYLALAIVQAGAYIWHSRCAISRYLGLFDKSRERTLTRSSEIAANVETYQRSVYTTWYMSYQQLSDRAKQLLWLMAHMHHDGISEAMFRQAAINVQTYEPAVPASDTEAAVYAYVKAHLQSYLDLDNSWDAGAFLDVISELLSYSLISYDQVNSTYTLHVLVHDWASTVAPHPRVTAVGHTMLLLAVSVKCGNTVEECVYQRRLGVHVQSVLERGVEPTASHAEQFAEVYYWLGRWDRKEAMERMVVDVKKQEIGEEHSSTLRSMHLLARTYNYQGRYKEAETLFSRVLGIQKRVLGEQHPDTLLTMQDFAITYYSHGRYEEAEMLSSQALHAQKQVLGGQHPDTLKSMHNLACTYHNRGRYKEAETLYSQVLDIEKRVFGDQHPNTLLVKHGLALAYKSQGRYNMAEALFLHVLDIQQRVLDEYHPDTLLTMHNLAMNYYEKGQYKEAETLYSRVLDIGARVLGDRHPHTLLAMHSLALAKFSQSHYEEAEILYLQVLGLQKRVLGEHHPDTLSTMHNLAVIYHTQGRYDEVEALYSQVLDARKRVLGEQHPKTLLTMHGLALTYKSQGRYEKAETLYSQVLGIQERALGEHHPDTLSTMHNLGVIYHTRGQYKKAEMLHLQLLDIRKRVLGEQHPNTLLTMHSLAFTYSRQCRCEEAEALFSQVFEIGKQVLGPGHPRTLAAMRCLADHQSPSRPSESQ